MHLAVKQYLASQRSGTHKTKTRAEVSGSGKKPWRQKGTGRARVGEIRNPLWRKGGTVFGPQPRDYAYHLPQEDVSSRSEVRAGNEVQRKPIERRRCVYARDHKTKAFSRHSRSLVSIGRFWSIDHQDNPNLCLAARNLSDVQLIAESAGHALSRSEREPRRVHQGGDSGIAGGAEEMSTMYEVIKRPVITEKGLTLKENERTLCFEVADNASKTADPGSRRAAFQSESAARAHDERARQDATPRQIYGLPPGLEEGVRHASRRRKDDRVRGELSNGYQDFQSRRPTRFDSRRSWITSRS